MKSYDFFLDSSLRGSIQPFVNWNIFLKEGKNEFEKLLNIRNEMKHTRNDFDFVQVLGEGAYGKVYLAILRSTGKEYAVKMIDKHKIVKAKRQSSVNQERKILRAINFPFCIKIEMYFHSPRFSYLCLTYLPGGDMYKHLRERYRFLEKVSRFYAAQMVLALEYLHYLNLVHRDVKPENIVLDSNGYIKLADFGFCKKLGAERTYTFCGTPEYVAPEIILQKGYGKSVDWWSFGVLIFEMSAGFTPFEAAEVIEVYERTINGLYYIPDHFSPDLSNLIENLIQADLSKRYGNLKRGVDDIKDHPWFRSIDWEALYNFSIPAPFLPQNKTFSPKAKITDDIADINANVKFDYYDF